MSQTVDMWLVDQLRRMAKSQPERFEGFVRSVKTALPAEFEGLALMAVDEGSLTTCDCAAVLMLGEAEVDVRLEGYRNNSDDLLEGVIEVDLQGTARIADTQVAVWEVVRVFRRVASVAELKLAYNSLSERELRAALAYAGNNPDEIALSIEQYEAMVNRKREAYPFAVAEG